MNAYFTIVICLIQWMDGCISCTGKVKYAVAQSSSTAASQVASRLADHGSRGGTGALLCEVACTHKHQLKQGHLGEHIPDWSPGQQV